MSIVSKLVSQNYEKLLFITLTLPMHNTLLQWKDWISHSIPKQTGQ